MGDSTERSRERDGGDGLVTDDSTGATQRWPGLGLEKQSYGSRKFDDNDDDKPNREDEEEEDEDDLDDYNVADEIKKMCGMNTGDGSQTESSAQGERRNHNKHASINPRQASQDSSVVKVGQVLLQEIHQNESKKSGAEVGENIRVEQGLESQIRTTMQAEEEMLVEEEVMIGDSQTSIEGSDPGEGREESGVAVVAENKKQPHTPPVAAKRDLRKIGVTPIPIKAEKLKAKYKQDWMKLQMATEELQGDADRMKALIESW
ncbi:hypothetical protein U9M48_042248 [Paspalum notatum var. saurae]|uniref:Uncharacterized protein n=1 Tax=Paspalum notatum var. saurae TaxID=547442 RepID=A0AAQ3UUQ6_PASNO